MRHESTNLRVKFGVLQHQIKMASSNLIHFNDLLQIAHVADEIHKSQVQHNNLTRINVADEYEEI